MRKILCIAILLGTFGLGSPAPVRAQGFGVGEGTVVDTYEMKKLRRKRQMYGMGGMVFLALIAGLFILMNSIDRRAANRRREQELIEKQEQGLL
jgi:hypothetical protein